MAAAICVPAVAHLAQANFADAAGFSGRGGFTCVACHTQPSPQPARVTLAGLPEAGWSPGATYALRVEVTGGPPALPDPAPKGGFDLASSAGAFAVDDGLLRLPSATEVTYRPAGTMMRAWELTWTAPGLEAEPVPAKFWLAAIAANGNHVVALNASDGGETLDAAATLTAVLPPSAAALADWRALPLERPEASVSRDAAASAWIIDGHHLDGNATAVAWRAGGSDGSGGPGGPEWTLRPGGRAWRIALPAGLDASYVEVRSEGAGRASAPLALSLAPTPAPEGAPGAPPGHADPDAPARQASAPALPPSAAAVALACLILILAARRHP